jgi:polar amino acid transport system substrate-binding protein
MLGFIALLTILIGPAKAVQQPTIRFLVSEAWSLPNGEIVNTGGQLLLKSGIVKEWQEAIAEELGYKVKNVYLPKNRMGMSELGSSYDVFCLVAPEWLGDFSKTMDWLPPYDTIEERLVGPIGTNKIVNIKQLENKRIGTVLGYIYPKLEAFFKNKNIKRDDATDEVGVLQKQLLGRVDYSVMRVMDFQYAKVSRPELKNLEISNWVVSITPIQCARSRSSHIPFKILAKAQERLLKAGKYSSIVKRYL